MEDKISLWLGAEEKNYKAGIDLFSSVTRNRFLLRQLSKRETTRNLAKLTYELNKYLSRALPIKETQVKEKPSPKKEIKQADPPPLPTNAQDKKAVEKLEIALGKMHNKKGILSNQLRNFSAGDNKARKAVLTQIDGLNEDMNNIRTKLDYYNKNGRLPPLEETPTPKEKTIPEDPLQMKQMLLNLRTSRTKINNQLNTETKPAEITKLKTRLHEKLKLIEEIERRLNAN